MQPSGPARVGAAISVLIKVRPPRPPRPRPRPSYLPIAIKSPTRSASAKRTRQPPALRIPGDTRGMGPRLRAQTGGLERASFLSPRLFGKHRWAGMLAPIRTIASGPLPRTFFPTSPSPPSLLTLHPLPPPRPRLQAALSASSLLNFRFPPSLACRCAPGRAAVAPFIFAHPRAFSLLSPTLCWSLETRSPSRSPLRFHWFPVFAWPQASGRTLGHLP